MPARLIVVVRFMKTTLFMVTALMVLTAGCGSRSPDSPEPYFAPGIVSARPTKDQRTPYNGIKLRADCERQHGEWFDSRQPNQSYCVLPYADAGRLCKTSSDCIGHCTTPLDGRTLEGKVLPDGYGICQLNDSTDDCGRPHFENGETIFFKCD